jgi:hypothetical protein
MAETKSEKTGQSGHTETEQRVRRGGEEAKRAIIDQGLLELLDAHAKAVAVEVGEVLVDKLARLQTWPTAGKHSELARETREEIEREHEHGEEAWLTNYPHGDREHLRKTDRELRRLEETLQGPERFLDRRQDVNRPPVSDEGTWQLPEYKPVPPDRCEKMDGGA